MNRAICGDNRFEIIEKAKQAILEETNIKDDKAQMAELDSFLFRCWQMGWLKKYEQDNEGQALLYAVEKTAERTKKEVIEKAVDWIENKLYVEPIFEYDKDDKPINYVCVSSCDSVEEFINEFKQAMEK